MDISTLLLILGTAILVTILLYIGYAIGRAIGEERANRRWKELEPGIREDAAKRSRAVLGGHFSEQLAPYLPGFPYNPTEVRFIGKPIDFIVFKNLDKKEPTEIIFVEVKSGNSKLSEIERRLKEIIKNKRVSWNEYRVPEGIT